MRQKSLQTKLQQSVSLVIVITLLASYMMAIFLVYNQTSASMREEIEKGRGSQFDPVFADIMLAMIDEDTEYQMREV